MNDARRLITKNQLLDVLATGDIGFDESDARVRFPPESQLTLGTGARHDDHLVNAAFQENVRGGGADAAGAPGEKDFGHRVSG
jgi:hypothetical protein